MIFDGTRLAIIAWLVVCAIAQQNVTVDDSDPSIIYAPAGAWVLSANSSLDVGGAHMLTQNPNATATFQFTGVAIYYLSPKWPYTVNTAVSLDDGTVILIDLVDHSLPDVGQGPETVQSEVVWSATQLNNTLHTLVVSVGSGQPFGVVDALIYTTLIPINASTTSALPSSSSSQLSSQPSSQPSQPSSQPSSQSSPQSSAVVAPPFAPASSATSTPTAKNRPVVQIVLGSLFGFVALTALILFFIYLCKRRNRPRSEAWTIATDPTNDGGGGTSYTSSSRKKLRKNDAAQGIFHPVDGTMPGPFAPPAMRSKHGYVGDAPPRAPPYDPAMAMYNERSGGYIYDPPPPQQQPVYADAARAPNRYQPGYTLSTITEKSTQKSTPRMQDAATHTPASGQSELGFYSAATSEGGAAAGTQPRYQRDRRAAPSSKGSAR